MSDTIIRYPFFVLEVTEPNKTYLLERELSKKTIKVLALQVWSREHDKLWCRGSQRIEIGGDELFPDNFPSGALQSTGDVNPYKRYFPMGEVSAGDLSIKMRFTDTDYPNVGFDEGYKLFLLLRTEEKL